MDILDIAFRLLIALALGAAIGLEREINEKKSLTHNNAPTAVLGIRSFSLIAIFGATTGLIYLKFIPLALLITASFFIILLIFYYLDSRHTQDYGLTTEVAALYSFVIGLLVTTGVLPLQITIAITTIVVLLLSQKDKIKKVVGDVQQHELNTFIVYAILALVIMPFLPNTNYSAADIKGLESLVKNLNLSLGNLAKVDLINPFKTWLILVLITGVDLVSYILGRVIGERKGWLIASAVGGLISSTATTQSIAQQSKNSPQQNHLVAAAILANLVSFFQIALLIGLVNGIFLVRLTSILGILIVVSTGLFFFFLKTKEKQKKELSSQKVVQSIEIIDLPGALKFVGLYLVISVVSKIALSLFGSTGLLVTTAIGAFVGLDAVMINTAQLAGGKVEYNLAIFAFILANSINLAAKSCYVFVMGKKEFALKFSTSMAAIIGASLIGYFLI